jgi:hypothetical protein
MATLHIEHPITDYETWRTAFDAFAAVRHDAGVQAQRVALAVDGPTTVVVDLDFDSLEHTRAFLQFLETHVWSSPASSPALAGAPRTSILQLVPTQA